MLLAVVEGTLCEKRGCNAVHGAVVPGGSSIANLRRRRGLVEFESLPNSSTGKTKSRLESWRRFCPTSQNLLGCQVPQFAGSLRVSRWSNFLQRLLPISRRAIRFNSSKECSRWVVKMGCSAPLFCLYFV
jgi:hypothetical protein